LLVFHKPICSAMFCYVCGTGLAQGSNICSKCGIAVPDLHSADAGAGVSGLPNLRDRLVREMQNESTKATARAEALTKSPRPGAKEYHWHHALNKAVASLQEFKGIVCSVDDLKGVKGFGERVRSLAKTCIGRIMKTDPTVSPRPKRPRIKAFPTHPYQCKKGSQPFAILCMMRRHDAVSFTDFVDYDARFGYAKQPIISGIKGWTGNPMKFLMDKKMVTGSADTYWALTADGEEVADNCLYKWDHDPRFPAKTGGEARAQASDDEAEEEGGEKPEKKKKQKREPVITIDDFEDGEEFDIKPAAGGGAGSGGAGSNSHSAPSFALPAPRARSIMSAVLSPASPVAVHPASPAAVSPASAKPDEKERS